MSVAGNDRLQSVWSDLDKQERALKLEQKHLQEIWLKVCDVHKANEDAREELEGAKQEAGLRFVDPSTPVRLNVGGQRFETTAGVLCRDEFSVLAGLCRGSGSVLDSRLPADPATDGEFGGVFIDRDWWLFRHVLQFLRTATLPDDPMLVEELYHEATFYRLQILRQAIETKTKAFHERQRKAAPAAASAAAAHRQGRRGSDCGCGGSCGGCGGGGGSGGSHHLDSSFLGHSQSLGRSAGRMPARRPLPDPFGFTVASHTAR